MRYINRKVPIVDVARSLNLRLDGAGKIHCWHPERHENGDRTASVGIRIPNNTVKCFGCDSRPIGPIDLVMDVRALGVADAALWIAERFTVPTIPAGKQLEEPDRCRTRFGHEQGLGLLVTSGLWGTLSEAARSIAPVFLKISEREPTDREWSTRMSYRAISRYSGVQSPNAVRRALLQLHDFGFLVLPEVGLHRSPNRQACLYVVTPNSDVLMEAAHAFSAQIRSEIAAERELRERLRKERIRVLQRRGASLRYWAGQGDSTAASLPHTSIPAESTDQPNLTQRAGTKYKPLYSTDSVNQQDAFRRITRSSIPEPETDAGGGTVEFLARCAFVHGGFRCSSLRAPP